MQWPTRYINCTDLRVDSLISVLCHLLQFHDITSDFIISLNCLLFYQFVDYVNIDHFKSVS